MITADLTPIFDYTSAVEGVIEAVASSTFQSDYNNYLADKLSERFMIDAIAAKDILYHVFDWGSMPGERGIPLFKTIKMGNRNPVLSYVFLPSTQAVPQPNIPGYNNLSRHKFRMKALVMETSNSVTISPKPGKTLVIPRGDEVYYSRKPVTINPGGRSTGRFAGFWTSWFNTVAPFEVKRMTDVTEQYLGKNATRIVRYVAGSQVGGSAVGGRIAKAQRGKVSFAKTSQAENMMRAALKKEYGHV